MKVLLDLNIWIDIAARRKEFPQSRLLLKKLEEQNHEVCFPLSSYTTFYYLLRKLVSEEGAITFILLLRQRAVQFLSFSSADVRAALGMNFQDHEDACIAATALLSGCDCLVTRDARGFLKSPVRAVTPATLLRELK